MALKLTSKIPIQVFFQNSSFFPAISDNLWLGVSIADSESGAPGSNPGWTRNFSYGIFVV